jgi:hypothetical protein
MSEAIQIELEAPCDAAGFVEYLATRGLAGSIRTVEDHCSIEVRYAVDPEVRLRQEFEAALADWLEQGGRPLVPTVDQEHRYVIRPPGD